MTDQGGARGTRESGGAGGLIATVETRELGAKVEPLGRRAEAESGSWETGNFQPRWSWRLTGLQQICSTDGRLRMS